MIYFFVVLIAFFLSYSLFSVSVSISYSTGAIDIPNKRKIHTQATARGGGIMFFASFSFVLMLVPIDPNLKIPLLLGGIVMFLVGFLDDTVNLSPFMKLSGQFLAVSIYHFSTELILGNITAIEGILISLWILFITNATNIIDGLDGLAGGVCTSEVICLASLSLIFSNGNIFICCLLLLGAILGFLPRNFPNAKIFMGDCGALFLGFTLAVLSSRLIMDSKSIICLLSVFLIFRIPTYDTNLSIIRRLIKRKNPFKADKEHFHHQLIKMGFSKECTTLALITASLLFGFLGIILSCI